MPSHRVHRAFSPILCACILTGVATIFSQGAFAADPATADAAAIKDLPTPADAQARRQAFAERNSPAEIEAVAKRLFSYWDFREGSPSREPTTQNLRHEKSQVTEFLKKQDYPAALAAYRTYFLHKVQILTNSQRRRRTGFDSRDENADQKSRYQSAVDFLMKGEYHLPDTSETVRLGEPGLVSWGWKASTQRNPWDSLKKPTIEYFCDSEFNKLWWKFVDSKDVSYLERWQAYLDDYAMNDHFQEDLSALNLDLGKAGMGDTLGFFDALVNVSAATPAGGEVVSPVTLARMMLHQIEVVIPQSSFYNRQQSNNHSPAECAYTLDVCEYIFDFKLAKTLEVETRRQFENYGTLDMRPDGAGPGRLPEYAMFEFKENIPTLDYFLSKEFDWLTPMQNREYRDRMLARAYYMILVTTPTGEYRVAVNTDDRRLINYQDKIRLFTRYYPELFDDPNMFKISALTLKQLASPDWQGNIRYPRERPLANMGLGSASSEVPDYDSFSYPYDRINVMSNGWDPNTNQYGVLIGESAHRGDSFMKENKATNHFGLSAFNRDIFRSGVSYAYNYLDSPMLVDGQDEFSGAGEGPISRRASGNYGLDPISKDRIHYSADFDVSESVYDWAYANTGTHNPEYYLYQTKIEALSRAIWGVSHRRIVQFVKKQGFWIVTDLMTSVEPHEYAQQWWLAEMNKEAPDGYALDQVHAEEATHRIHSEAPDGVNFSMYHIGPADLDRNGGAAKLSYDPIAEKPEAVDKFTGPRLDRHAGFEYIQLRGSWKSQGGRSQLVTVIYPRKNTSDDLLYLTANQEGNGFTACLRNCTQISYAASFGKPERLVVAGLAYTAESLLVVRQDGKTSGLVMGKTGRNEVAGIPIQESDFEFGEDGIKPIYRPIEPVEISPGINGFSESITVTMKTPTPGTNIRYTVDGNDPTLESQLYTGPVTFTDTVMVKVRAFRANLHTMPPLTPTGTEMTSVATAVYTREPYHAPDTWTKTTLPGLKFDYFEAKWPYFIYDVNPNLKPITSGTVEDLLDTSAKSNKPQAFAFVYHGFLSVPVDGVYTIYAPSEFTMYRPMAGYDLKVRLGYHLSTDNGKQTLGGGSPLEEWYPATRRHAFGTWSIALKQGLQPFSVYFADMRPGARLQYGMDDFPGWNVPGLTKVIWDGTVPTLEISGPGLSRQAIPREWLRHE